jgi:hypothetical protein
MNRRHPMNNGNIRNHMFREHPSYDAPCHMMRTDTSQDLEYRGIDDSSKTLVIRPLQEVGSTCVVYPGATGSLPLQQIQNVHVHRLGSFKDLRLNLKEFHSLKTLVVHTLPDLFIQNTNFGNMDDNQVYDLATGYLFHHRRHRHFRDNLNLLHQNEGKGKNFSLKVLINGTDRLTFIIVDLDKRAVERGIRCLPRTFSQSPREEALCNALVPRIQIYDPCYRVHSDAALLEQISDWPPNGPFPVPGALSPWYSETSCKPYRHVRDQQLLAASRHPERQPDDVQTQRWTMTPRRQENVAASQCQQEEDAEECRMADLTESLLRMMS